MKIRAKDLRKSVKREKASCYICGRYETVCEWHHVVSLKEVAGLLQIDNESEIDIPLVCLCPTHHALFHKTESTSSDRYLAIAELHSDNDDKTREILSMRNKTLLELGEYGRVFV